MFRAVLCVAFLAAALAVPAVSATGYAFGRQGGSIRPFTVTVTPTGAVRVSGPVAVGRVKITAAQLASLARVAASTHFSRLPATTRCPGTLPDIASTFVSAGGRTVSVHGACVQGFTRVWTALAAAVRLSY